MPRPASLALLLAALVLGLLASWAVGRLGRDNVPDRGARSGGAAERPNHPAASPGQDLTTPGTAHRDRRADADTPAVPEAPGRPTGASSDEVEPSWTFHLVGQVVDEAGTPVGGATCLPWLGDLDAPWALTGANGAFDVRVRVDPAALRERVRLDGRVHLWITARGFASRVEGVELGAGLRVDLGRLVLVPGGWVEGTVRDEAGAPVPRAQVYWNRAEREHEGWRLPAALADAGGVYRLPGVPLVESFLVGVGDAGEGDPSRLFTPLRDGTLGIDLVVPTAQAPLVLAGHVRLPGGEPAAGARVSLVAEDGDSYQSTEADEQGAYRIEFLPWEASTTVRAEDPARAHYPVTQGGQAPGTTDTVLVLGTPRWLEVRLVDPEGAPIPWGHIASSRAEPLLRRTAVGEGGVIRILRPTNRFRLRAMAPGFREETFGPFEPNVPHLELAMTPGQAVRGTVTAAGRPVPGARVNVLRGAAPGRLVSGNVATMDRPFHIRGFAHTGGHDATTDGEGRYAVTLYNDGWHVVTVQAEGYPDTCAGPFRWIALDGAEGVDVELLPAGALAGVLRPLDGQDPSDYLVAVSNGWGRAWVAACDPRGGYRFEGLAPGPYQVRVTAPPQASVVTLESTQGRPHEPVWDVEVHPGGTSYHDLDLAELYPCRVLGSLRLDGQAVPGARVTLWLPGSGEALGDFLAEGETDAGGRFELRAGPRVGGGRAAGPAGGLGPGVPP